MTIVQPAAKTKASRRAWSRLLHRVVRTIRSRGLFCHGQHLLVAVSGGPDSVALLSLLHRLQASWSLTLTAVHFNYGLRGAESEADQEFVAALCRKLEIPLRTRRLDVGVRSRRTSLQAAARVLRYRAMADLAEQYGADRIAVGHTADDQAETVLLWMLRGAGLTGLSGMPAFREDAVIRPLYETKRHDILAYLDEAGLAFRRDSSNTKPLYLRNRIRQDVIPLLQRLVPSSVDSLCRLADLCREDDRYLDQHVAALCGARIRQEADGGWTIDRSFLERQPRAVQRRVIREVLRRNDPLHRSPSLHTVETILQAMSKGSGNGASLAGKSTRLVVGKDCVHFHPSRSQEPSRELSGQAVSTIGTVPARVGWAGTRQIIQVQILERSRLHGEARGKHCIEVDGDRISGPLVVRAWQPGDRFYPTGMKGRSKKLQDFFMDLKVPVAARKRIPLVVAPEGIVWIVGYRQDERWVPTIATKRRLVMTVGEDSTEEGR